jgi:hypothetical protein
VPFFFFSKRYKDFVSDIISSKLHNWVWELVPSEEGTIPIEEQESLPTQKADCIWMSRLKLNEGQRDAYKVDRILEGADLPKLRSTMPLDMEDLNEDKIYGNILAVKWQNRIRKDGTSVLRTNDQVRGEIPSSTSKKVDWKDPWEKEKKEQRRKERGQDWTPIQSTSTKQTREIGIPLLNNSKTGTDSSRSKSYLNPNEPEYRQSRKGANDVPLGLQDPRRRQYGFHYGLPKQKELLRAANAREYDQEEWLGMYAFVARRVSG